MTTKLRSWWLLGYIGLVIVGLLVVALVIRALVVNGTGFDATTTVTVSQATTTSPTTVTTIKQYQPGKTLWDWMQLLIIPVALGIGGFWLSQIQKSSEQRTVTDNQREAALQGYIDKISELLLKEHLDELKPEFEKVREIARARTLTVLPQLDAERKLSVLRFLGGSQLLQIVPLSVSDLSGIRLHDINERNIEIRDANLMYASLNNSTLEHIDLNYSNLSHADISNSSITHCILDHVNLSHTKIAYTDLSNCSLIGADLRGAELSHINLSGVNLEDAKGITVEKLEKKAILKGAILPDGSVHS